MATSGGERKQDRAQSHNIADIHVLSGIVFQIKKYVNLACFLNSMS